MRVDTPKPSHGRLFSVAIPGGASGFHARRAYVYEPPAAMRERSLRFPVLVLLHGNPGGPIDWSRYGHVVATLDSFAAAHDGRAPIAVMPDINGARHADTECVRTPGGADVSRYLTAQVPAYIRAHLPVSTNPASWALAGVSEGGMCSLMLALRAYPRWRAFGDLSGLARPTLGDSDDPTLTIARLFGGSRSAYNHHDPLWLLARHRYPRLAGWMFAGRSDRAVAAAQTTVSRAARAAGVTVTDVLVPGGHRWTLWAKVFPRFVTWVWPLLTRHR